MVRLKLCLWNEQYLNEFNSQWTKKNFEQAYSVWRDSKHILRAFKQKLSSVSAWTGDVLPGWILLPLSLTFICPPSSFIGLHLKLFPLIKMKVSWPPVAWITNITHRFDWPNPCGAGKPLHIDQHPLTLVHNEGMMVGQSVFQKDSSSFLIYMMVPFFSKGVTVAWINLFGWRFASASNFLINRIVFSNLRRIKRELKPLSMYSSLKTQSWINISHLREVQRGLLLLFCCCFFFFFGMICFPAALIWNMCQANRDSLHSFLSQKHYTLSYVWNNQFHYKIQENKRM